MKSKLILVLLLIIITGCNRAEVSQNEGDVIIDDGYKPVILYQGAYYWLSVDPPLKELPEGFVDSEVVIQGCNKDVKELPKEEFYTSGKNCSDVGSKIYINPEDPETIITAKYDTIFNVFLKGDVE